MDASQERLRGDGRRATEGRQRWEAVEELQGRRRRETEQIEEELELRRRWGGDRQVEVEVAMEALQRRHVVPRKQHERRQRGQRPVPGIERGIR